MSVSVTINGTSYTIPTTGETGWGNNVTTWIQAASQHLLQKTGGAFTLTAEVNFGATYGLKSVYYKSSAGTVSTTGAVRLGASDLISWRNSANTQDLELSVDSNDRINFNGQPIISSDGLQPLTAVETDNDGAIRSSVVTRAELSQLSGILSAAVGVSDTQTLTNKTIDGDSNTVQDLALGSLKTVLADASKFIVRDASGVVVSNTKAVPTGDVVGTSDTQTLTNKTIDADQNTISNIENADIKVGAAIARTKLASGTADHVVINDASGVMSSEAQLSKTRGGTGISSTATFPSSGVVVTEAGTQTLTNKTIDADQNTISNIENADIKVGAAIDRTKLASGTANHVIINNGSGVMSSEAQLAISRGGTGQSTATLGFNALAPTTTAGDFIVHNGTNNVRQGIGSDGQVLVVDTTQTNKLKWTSLQQGAKNYITYNNFENNALTGWKEASVTWTSGAPSGAPTVGDTAAASIALSVTATTPLAGSYSLQMVGTIAQGQGFCTDVLSIDREDQAKVLQGSFYYEVMANPTNANWSGTSSNTLCVYIYDVTNSAWIQPAGVYNLVQSSGQGLCSFTFQTPASISQFRLFVFAANTASGSITVNFDDFAIGPQKILSGAAISDFQSYTPTIYGVTTNPTKATGATESAYWRRIGDSIEIIYTYEQAAVTGAATGSGTYIIGLPSGLTIDTTKIKTSTSNENGICGAAAFRGNASTTQVSGYAKAVDAGSGKQGIMLSGILESGGAQTDFDSTNYGFAANATLRFSFNAKVPVSGFSSNTVMSSDTDTRVCHARYYMSTNATPGANTQLNYDTKVVDTHGAVITGAGAWKFVCPVSGTFQVDVTSNLQNATTSNIALYKNGSIHKGLYFAATDGVRSGCTTVELIAGDYIDVRGDAASQFNSTNQNTSISIFRLSGPATIAASELVCLKVGTSDTTSIASSATGTMIWNTVYINTHNTLSGNTTFTAPVSGTYSLKANIDFNASANTIGQGINIRFYKNGSAVTYAARFYFQTTSSTGCAILGVDTLKLNAGDTITVVVANNTGSAKVPSGAPEWNYLCIERIGN